LEPGLVMSLNARVVSSNTLVANNLCLENRA